MAVATAFKPGLVHEALAYASDEEFVARVVPFLRDGLTAGETALAVLTPEKTTLLRKALGEDAQRVQFSDSIAHYRRPANALAEFRRRLDEELPQPGEGLVRVIAEIPFTPSPAEHAEWTGYESVVNQALADYPVWIICGYDTRTVPEDVVAEALCLHPFVSTGGTREPNPRYTGAEEPVQHRYEPALGGREPLAELTVGAEGDLHDLRRVLTGAARAAGLEPQIVDDVAVAVCELVRDGLRHGEGDALVRVSREGARLHCEVTESDARPSSPGVRIGPAIARLVSERVEVASAAGTRTVRLTFAGAADARQRILDAASELFYREGIRATGVNTIVAHAGIAKATFFNHFPTKGDLACAWLRQPASRWFDWIRSDLDARTEPAEARLLAFFDLLGEWFARDDFRGCAFLNAAAETPEADHPVRQAAQEYTREIRRYLEGTATEAGFAEPARIAEQLHLLALGAIATAVATRSPDAAGVARAAAERLLTTA
jgi:AcrR family transcriptional regulator